jgi:two-component system KDP operon response regulator KdpE
LLRRAGPAPSQSVIAVGSLEIDLAGRIVRDYGKDVRLTRIEYDLLRALARNKGKLMTHRALLSEVWGPGHDADIHTLRFHIANLRRKIEPSGRREHHIRTEIGVGYRFEG